MRPLGGYGGMTFWINPRKKQTFVVNRNLKLTVLQLTIIRANPTSLAQEVRCPQNSSLTGICFPIWHYRHPRGSTTSKKIDWWPSEIWFLLGCDESVIQVIPEANDHTPLHVKLFFTKRKHKHVPPLSYFSFFLPFSWHDHFRLMRHCPAWTLTIITVCRRDDYSQFLNISFCVWRLRLAFNVSGTNLWGHHLRTKRICKWDQKTKHVDLRAFNWEAVKFELFTRKLAP